VRVRVVLDVETAARLPGFRFARSVWLDCLFSSPSTSSLKMLNVGYERSGARPQAGGVCGSSKRALIRRPDHGTLRREPTDVTKGGGECTLLALPAASAG
jgi:hypothetical protein